MISKKKSYSILKDDVIFSVDLELVPFGNKYRVILREPISGNILISELFDSEEEALDRFYEIERPLILISDFLIEGKKENALRYSNEFWKLLPKFKPELFKVVDEDVEKKEEEEIEEEDFLKDASFFGSFGIEKKGKFFLFEVFESGNKFFGKWNICGNGIWKSGKVLEFSSVEKLIDYLELFKKDEI